jgi:uridine phosphorylase
VTLALRQAARNHDLPHHVGLSQSKDSFYGQHEPDRMPIAGQLKDRWQAWIEGGTLSSEMEASTIFVVARILQCRAGGIMLAGGTHDKLSSLLETSVSAIKILIEQDQVGR